MKKLEDIFFEVYKTFEIFAEVENSKYVSNNNYYAILKKDNNQFLGIKREHHDLYTNKEIYNWSVNSYKKLTGTENVNTYFVEYSKDKNWFAIIIGGQKLYDFTFTNKQKEKNPLYQNFSRKELFNQFPHDQDELKQLFSEKLDGLEIGYAIVNGYDINYAPNLFLVVLKDNSNYLEILPIARQSINKSNTISSDFVKDYYFATYGLTKHIIDYIQIYYHRFRVEIQNDENLKKGVLYNLFNINLSPITLKEDKEFQKKILDFEKDLDEFLKHNNTNNYSVFSDFMIYYYGLKKINLKLDFWQKVKDTLTVKEVYRRSISRLKNILTDNYKRKKYEVECQENYQKVEEIILKLKKQRR